MKVASPSVGYSSGIRRERVSKLFPGLGIVASYATCALFTTSGVLGGLAVELTPKVRAIPRKQRPPQDSFLVRENILWLAPGEALHASPGATGENRTSSSSTLVKGGL